MNADEKRHQEKFRVKRVLSKITRNQNDAKMICALPASVCTVEKIRLLSINQPALIVCKVVNDQRGGLGLCRTGCGQPRVVGKATCQTCLDAQRKKKDQLKTDGLCVTYCGNNAVPGRTKCRLCIAKTAYRNAIYYAKEGGYKTVRYVDGRVYWLVYFAF
jgi:hypothetical protein